MEMQRQLQAKTAAPEPVDDVAAQMQAEYERLKQLMEAAKANPNVLLPSFLSLLSLSPPLPPFISLPPPPV